MTEVWNDTLWLLLCSLVRLGALRIDFNGRGASVGLAVGLGLLSLLCGGRIVTLGSSAGSTSGVNDFATSSKAFLWLGCNWVTKVSTLGLLRMLPKSLTVAVKRSIGVATGTASLLGIHVTVLTIRSPLVSKT